MIKHEKVVSFLKDNKQIEFEYGDDRNLIYRCGELYCTIPLSDKGQYWFKYKCFKFPISSKNFKNLKVFKYNSFDDTFKKYYDEYLLDIEKENKVNM